MRYWTSDLHIDHQNIITFCNRPFTQPPFCFDGENPDEFPETLLVPDVEKMNKALFDNWNDTVDDGDEVWVVGDLAMGRLQTSVPKTKHLKGKKILVPGNHDGCHKMHGKYKKFVSLYEDAGFTIMDSQVTTEVDGTEVLVCHFPYRFTFKGDDRFTGNRPDNEGKWLIHGHTHAVEKTSVSDRQIHVGVDAHDYRPVSEDWVAQIIRENP